MNDENKFEIIKFEDENISLDVKVKIEDNTVWLTQKDMSILFNVSLDNISLHIKNVLKTWELEGPTSKKFMPTSEDSSVVQTEGNRQITRKIKVYNLDMITAVGNRTKSKETEIFRAWALEIKNNFSQKNTSIEPIISFNQDGVCLDVNVSPAEETVWLTQAQMAELFDTTQPNISMHINNIYEDDELEETSTYKDFLYVQTEGNRQITRVIKMYNLDMILAIGYRVNSKRGIMFRRWASDILHKYLFNGYVINKDRCLACTSNILNLENEVNDMKKDLINIKDILYGDNEYLLFEGEILEDYSFIIKLFFLAKKEIIIVDSYADDFVLEMLKNITVPVTIYTAAYINNVAQKNITIIKTNIFHDRYIIIDNMVFSSGTSLNSIGKKRFTIHKLVAIDKEMLLQNIK